MKPCRLLWSARAARDLNRLKAYISYDKPMAAIDFIKKVKHKTERLKKFPLSGRIVPELSRQDIREILVQNYRIIYRTDSKSVFILTVFEGHQFLRVN